ncbi:Protein of unknown function [Fodinibius roseus]|uniref:DUF2442 domain-containing protein n=1 Tax=Fodinibius roseus TaxID=1194090 RepID=A0A1M5LT79_9BACT|nr:DUF2442 domain-containing protein [Fodinibius roseus]SHG68211.1 Protein of unknown function [Fodinibius roseus]
MSTLVKRKPAKAVEVWFEDKKLLVRIEDGRELAVPLEWFPKLRDAAPEELNNWSFIGNGIGIRWEDLDEDLSVEGLLH